AARATKGSVHEDDIRRGKEAVKSEMIELPGGDFLMGTEDKEGFPDDGEGPIRRVTIDPFYIDAATVTNAAFQEFIKATDYQTDAERFGWSFVFYQLLTQEVLATQPEVVPQAPWWCAIEGATWKHPEGPKTTIGNRMNHP